MKRRVIFVENREKTWLWAAVARSMMAQGWECQWIVQNPLFAPRNAGQVHIIPFPPRGACEVAGADSGELITDRGRDFFGAGSAHYAHYRAHIGRIVRAVQPLLVLGETTLFHELIAMAAAAEIGVPYWMPDGERYLQGRFTLLINGTQDRLPLDAGPMAAGMRRRIATQIADPVAAPSYMRKTGRFGQLRYRARWAVTRSRVIAARWRGERFNTPSLQRKLALERDTTARLARWDACAALPAPRARALLYPMQMQPESNLDVCGRPFHDQIENLRAMLRAAPQDVCVAVKANPKAKYEVSEQLLALAMAEPRLLLLPRDLPMRAAMACTVGAVTVTGTVGIEAVFGRGRCVTLRMPPIARLFPHMAAPDPASAVRLLLADARVGCGNLAMGEALIDYWHATSLRGAVSDPVSDPGCMDPTNVAAVASGLIRGMEWLHARAAPAVAAAATGTPVLA